LDHCASAPTVDPSRIADPYSSAFLPATAFSLRIGCPHRCAGPCPNVCQYRSALSSSLIEASPAVLQDTLRPNRLARISSCEQDSREQPWDGRRQDRAEMFRIHAAPFALPRWLFIRLTCPHNEALCTFSENSGLRSYPAVLWGMPRCASQQNWWPMAEMGQGRRINCADGVSGSHLIAAYCCAARLRQGARSGLMRCKIWSLSRDPRAG
jgi:hypothetical protein